MCTQLYAPMEIEKQIAFDKNNLASFRKKWATFKECLPEKYPPKYDFQRSLDEDFVRFESYLEAEILVSNFSLYELSVNRRKNITIWNEITSDYLKYKVMVWTGSSSYWIR